MWRRGLYAHVNKVTQRRVGLVLGWVAVRGFTVSVFNRATRGPLSLAIVGVEDGGHGGTRAP